MKLQMTALAILLSSVVTANAGNGWNFFGITVPYHNDPCWEMSGEVLYQDLCNPKDGNNNLIKSPVVDKPVAKPPKDYDDDSDTDGGDDVTDPGDHNGGDTSDHSDSNGDNSSDDSNGDNSDDRGDKKDKKRDRK